MKRQMKYKVFNIAAALIAAVCVICISVTAVVLARPLYYWDTDNLQIPETSGYSKEICIENYDALIDYNLIGGSEKLVFPSFSMSEQGEIHFAEVKEIFITMQVISIAGIILFAGFMLYRKLHRVPREGTLWMRFTGIVLLSAVVLIGLAMAIDWQWSFEFMHKVFFDNNYWLFDLKYDPVITILPDRFFLHCGILIVLISVTQSALLEWGYRRMNR